MLNLIFKRNNRPPAPPRPGVVATELAIVLPLLVLTCVLSMDLGRIVHSYICLSNAVRVGVERGATKQFTADTQASWRTRVVEAVETEMANAPRFDPARLTVNVSTTADSRQLMQVSVTGRYEFRTFIRWPGLNNPVVLNRRFVMRQYR